MFINVTSDSFPAAGRQSNNPRISNIEPPCLKVIQDDGSFLDHLPWKN